MKCQYCNDEIEIERGPDESGGGIWVIFCQCAEARHPRLEKGMELHEKMAEVGNRGKKCVR